MNEKLQECIDNCRSCVQICEEALEHCKSKGGAHANADHLSLLEDCAKICRLAADFMERGSANHADVCGVCARICELCVGSCEVLAEGDEMMQKCADACRKCAESCREMATTA